MPAGLRDVARESGYSVGTVSRALSGKGKEGRISDAAVRSIRRTATRLGYARDEIARALRTRTTRMLGLVVSDIANPFFGRIASLMEKAAEGYSILVCNSSEDPARERRYLELLAARRVDGVLISPNGPDATAAVELQRQGVTVITFDREYAERRFDAVVCNNRETAARLTRRLGTGPLGFVGGSLASSTHSDRLRGFSDVAHGPALCEADPATAAKKLMDREGLLFGNSLIAEGVLLWYLRNAPDRLKTMRFASFDDSPLFAAIRISVARQPEEEIARRAVALLERRLQGRNGKPRRVVLRQSITEG